MLSVRWQSGNPVVVVATLIMALMSGCAPTQYAYFQADRSNSQRSVSTATDSLKSVDAPSPQLIADSPLTATPSSSFTADSSAVKSSVQTSGRSGGINPSRHRNPDSYQNQRFSRLFRSIPIAHVAPQRQAIDRHSSSRKTYKLALIALGLAVLSFGSLFVSLGGTLGLIVGITLPLTATLLGTASLTTINRNQDRYRGRGWAMAAITLGAGALGLALIALAALSVHQVTSR